MTFFRAGDDDAFRVIHDRYRGPLLTYVRHVMGATHADAEDVLQDVFVRAYRGLRAHDRELNLSPWLYRVARNACIDELRRRVPVPYDELPGTGVAPDSDPVLAESITRDRVRQLMSDLQQLPEQQRSALILCEVSGMSYADVAAALGTTVSAIKSLLVRARLGLAHALEARETACSEIRDELALAHARGERPNALVRRHVHDCQGCRGYGHAMRDRQRQLAALTPAAGPVAVVAKLFGWGGAGSGAGAGAVAAGGAGGTAAASGGLTVSAGLIGANAAHVLTVLAATTVVAAGAVGIKEATTTTKPVRPAAPVHVTATPPATRTVTPVTVAGSLRGAAAARVVIHRVDASGSNPPLGSGGTSHTTATAPVTPLGGSATPATPTPTSAPTTSSSSSSSCGIGQQSCASQSPGTATTSPVTHATTKVPLGSGGSSTSTSTRPAHLSIIPIGGSTESGSTAAPPASSSSESSAPLGSTSSPPLGS